MKAATSHEGMLELGGAPDAGARVPLWALMRRAAAERPAPEPAAGALRAAQLAQVMRLSPLMMGANLAVGAVILGVFWTERDGGPLTLWACLLAALVMFKLRASARAQPRATASWRALGRTAFHAGLLGALWGAVPVLVFSDAGEAGRLVVGYVVVAMVAGGAFGLRTVPRAALAFVAGIVLPSIWTLLASDTPFGVAIALLLLAYAAAILALSAASYAMFMDHLMACRALERQRGMIEFLLDDVEEGASDWLWEVDASGRLRHVSKRLAGLTGRSAQALVGQPFLLLLDGVDPAAVRGLGEALSRGRAFRDVVVPLRVEGETRWWSLAAKPVQGEDGADGYRGIATERTTAKRAEQALIEAKEAAEAANRAKTAFLATMSHELRTPLNAILGFADLIRSEVHGPAGHPRYAEYAGDIVEGGTHLLAIINDILDTARIENGFLQLMEAPCCVATLAESVRRMAEPLASAGGLALVVEESVEEVDIRADGKRIRQILVNLVSNAVKFTPRGGRVTIGFGLGQGGELLLSVADTGIGVPADLVDAVFEPFRQLDPSLARSAGGTGLGLSIARRLARAHGGDLTFESRLGEGSRVTLTLPPERVLGGAERRLAG